MFHPNPRFVGAIDLSAFLKYHFALKFWLFPLLSSFFLEGLVTLKNKQAIFYTPEVFESEEMSTKRLLIRVNLSFYEP